MNECRDVRIRTRRGWVTRQVCAIDESCQRSILMGLESLPNDTRRLEYTQWLQSQYPADQMGIRAVSDCFQRYSRATQCLERVTQGQIIRGSSDQRVTMTQEQTNLAQRLTHLGERSLSQSSSRRAFIDRYQNIDPQLPTAEMQPANDIVDFYMSRLQHQVPYNVRAITNLAPTRDANWQLYQSRSTTPQTLNPSSCSNQSQWERHELIIQGLNYSLPVFIPSENHVAWSIYEELLQSTFDYLKLFMIPEDLERILHPGNQGFHDLSIYISDRRDSILHDSDACSEILVDYNGQYRVRHNRLAINMAVDDMSSHDIDRFLIHEFAHIIMEVFSTRLISGGTTTRNNMRQHVNVFYNWSLEHAIPNPNQRRMLRDPQYDWQDIVRFIQNGRISTTRDPFGYNQYIPQARIGGQGASYYGLRDWSEFFAEWIQEYVINAEMDLQVVQVTDDTGSGPAYARRRIMDQFFADQGINPEALSPANIQAIHREADVPMTLIHAERRQTTLAELLQALEQERPEPTTSDERRNDLSLTIPRLGYQSFSGDLNGTEIRGGGIVIGLSVGYLSRGMPTGFVGGVGIMFDASIGVHGDFTNNAIFDTGLWGRFGYNTGPVDLYIEPEIGFRYITLPEETDTPYFWLGTNAGLALGAISVFATARFSPNNWYSFGAGLSLDIATLWE